MIHQHIFASPKPGMTAQAFQQYWLEVHAVKYASKIPQIKKYKIDTRDPGETPFHPMPWEGIAEIWLRNDEEQLASMQTPEFLQGARLDEPNWAAFWNTQALDTDTQVVRGAADESSGVKLVVLSKRTGSLKLKDYRQQMLDSAAELKLPGLTLVWQCFTRDGWYEVGEPRFDGAAHYWFEDREALVAAMSSSACQTLVGETLPRCCEPRYLFAMPVTEHWVIGPQARE
jgi:hypothetical protein